MKKISNTILFTLLVLSITVSVFAYSAEGPLTDTAETDTIYLAGDPEEVAAVILHTNDVHVGYQDSIGYDGLAEGA